MNPLKHIPKSNNEDIDNGSFERLSEHSFADLIALTGMYGVFRESDGTKLLLKTYGTYPTVSVEIKLFQDSNLSRLLIDMCRVVNFQTKVIHNVSLKVAEPQNGIGILIFRDQIANAIEMGVKRIFLTAKGFYQIRHEYSGYIVWAKFGYTMWDDRCIRKFNKLMDKARFRGRLRNPAPIHLSSTTVNDLVADGQGALLWEWDGYTWEGEFYPQEKNNVNYLNIYLAKKSLKLIQSRV